MRIKNMKIQSLGLWGLAVLVLSLGLLVRIWLPSVRILAQPSTTVAEPPAPYTVTLEQSVISKTGQRKYTDTPVYAVRSDGSTVEKFSSPLGSDHPEVFRTVFLATGFWISIRDVAGL